ncbi:MAG TPA: DUF5615 family PIN-like protein [Thermoanaerobaculia bacterium]|nr:DUF5615 family PIN-like protein [Thermoanaerobaculia bacterium]
MRVLLDACVWKGCIEELRAAGHDVIWAGEWGEDPGDRAILERAAMEGRVLVTLDKDFGEIAIVRSLAHRGIIRLVGGSVTTFAPRLVSALSAYQSALEGGAIVTVEMTRTRIRHEP